MTLHLKHSGKPRPGDTSRAAARLRGLKPLPSGTVSPMLEGSPAPAVGARFRDKHGVEWVLCWNDPNVEATLRVLSIPDGSSHRAVDDRVTLSANQIQSLGMTPID